MYGNPTAGRQRLGALEALNLPIPAELVTFVRRTYGMLAFSVILGAAACWGMIRVMPTATRILEDGSRVTVPAFPMWGLILLWVGMLVFSLIGNMAKAGARAGEASPMGLVGLVGMVVCSGAMLGPTIGIYAGLGMMNVVAAAAITTGLAFTGLTAFVLISGKNFSFMGGFLFAALLAFTLAWFVGGFFAGPGFSWWMAAVGALLFCGYILFDTSSVVHYYGPQNLVVPAVIALYLDIFNLFLMLLILFTGRRNE